MRQPSKLALYRIEASGSVAPIFAIILLCLGTFAGFAIDYARLDNARSNFQQAADAAALAAAADSTASVEKAETVAIATFNSRAASLAGKAVPKVEVTRTSTEINVDIQVQARVPNTLLSLVGLSSTKFSVSSKAGQKFGEMELYAAIDMSSSLGIAANPSARAALMALTQPYTAGSADPDGCSFACHKRDGWEPGGQTVYDMAKGAGIALREDVLYQAFGGFVDSFMNEDDPDVQANRRRMAVFGFSDDADLLLPPSNVLADIKSAPAAFKDNKRLNTRFDVALDRIKKAMGPQGDGSPHSPSKWLLLVTDGLGWERNGPTTHNGPIDPALCDAFKNEGITLAVIEVKYQEDADEHWFNLQVAPFYSEISPALEACASPGFYYKAEDSDTQTLTEAFKAAATALRSRLALTR